MNDQDFRDALHEEASAAVARSSDWDDVLRRARSIRRRRRAVAMCGALVAAAVVIVTLVVTIGALDADNDRTIVATPGSREPSVVAALHDRRVVVMSAKDGRVLRTIVDDREHPVSGNISASSDGEFVYFSRLRQGRGECSNMVVPEVVRVRASGGRIDLLLVGGYDPLVSPDGRWLVYISRADESSPPCSSPLALHLLDLSTMEVVAKLYDVPQGIGVEAESWSSDSKRVLVLVRHPDTTQNELVEIVTSDAGAGTDGHASMLFTGAMTAATYVHGDEILVAALRPNQVTLQRAPGAEVDRGLLRIEWAARPDALAVYGVNDRLLAHLPDGTLRTHTGRKPARTIGRNVSAAAWLPPDSGASR